MRTSTVRRSWRSRASWPGTCSTRSRTSTSISSTCSGRSRSGTPASRRARSWPKPCARRSSARRKRSRAPATSNCPRMSPRAPPRASRSSPTARVGFTSADVVIAVGYDPVEYAAARWNPSGQLQIVHIDFTAAEVDARYQPAVEVVADVREALELLAPLVAARPQRVPPGHSPDDPRRLDDAFPLLPQRIIWDLESVLRPDDLVISDVGAHN